jgi:lipopolysaccharide transport system ATP-binding protein
MMSDAVIQIRGLGKRYRIGEKRRRYRTVRESLSEAIVGRFRRPASTADDGSGAFWAVRDVTFDVRRGEVVGIIGRNGAGKSTLLKMLSRITTPTEGEIEVVGRLGSLLEVGTGFHPELTGRENIYLNGAILGMTRGEINGKFDEIVAFGETERFLDTPVKFYSSGMYMRLAFAVAAHLEPEILVVDEVLAVGDAEFQKKCLGKMHQVADQGRTVLFVSHQMNAVRALCNRAVLLKQGRLVEAGETGAVLAKYFASDAVRAEWQNEGGNPSLDNPYFRPTRFALVGPGLETINAPVASSDPPAVLIEGQAQALNGALTVGFAVYAATGELLFRAYTTDQPASEWPQIKVGHNRLLARLPQRFLNEGEYRVELIVSLHYIEWLSQPGVNAPAIGYEVKGGLSDSPFWMEARPGFNAPVIPFTRLDQPNDR